MAKYEVIHPVNNGKLHPRGSVIELDAKDGATLHSQGHVKPLLVAEEEIVDLETLTKEQLVKYAFDKLGASLSIKQSKSELIEAIRFAIDQTAEQTGK